MKELSLHILDLCENSINAKASFIKIKIVENLVEDILTIKIVDNGEGMNKEYVKNVDNPFITTRKTRRVGLGISLFKVAAIRCDGNFKISSKKNLGTKVIANFKHSHIDRSPLGDIGDTIITILNSQSDFELVYIHKVNKKKFIFDTRMIKKILNDVDIKDGNILLWIRDYINENIKEIYKHK